MPGALRLADLTKCLRVEPGPRPHVAGAPIPSVPTVRINSRPALTVGDTVLCVGAPEKPDKIVEGIASVRVGGRPAADASAATDHGGRFATCSGDVRIG